MRPDTLQTHGKSQQGISVRGEIENKEGVYIECFVSTDGGRYNRVGIITPRDAIVDSESVKQPHTLGEQTIGQEGQVGATRVKTAEMVAFDKIFPLPKSSRDKFISISVKFSTHKGASVIKSYRHEDIIYGSRPNNRKY